MNIELRSVGGVLAEFFTGLFSFLPHELRNRIAITRRNVFKANIIFVFIESSNFRFIFSNSRI